MYKPVLNELFKSVICDFLQKGIEEEFFNFLIFLLLVFFACSGKQELLSVFLFGKNGCAAALCLDLILAACLKSLF